MATALLGGVTGAALEYLLDPECGRRRRSLARDRLVATGRRGLRSVNRAARRTAARGYGLAQQVRHRTSAQPLPANDATLKSRVESELGRHPALPLGRVNINAEEGIVVLRGELDRPEQIQAFEAVVRTVAGVRDVENLLHLPGTPPPASATGRSASR